MPNEDIQEDNVLPKEDKSFAAMRNEHEVPWYDNLLAKLIKIAEFFGLLIITIATLVAGVGEVMHMINMRAVTLGDLLLLFLYLEVLAMIGIYLKSGKLPIRFPIYIAIVALARILIIDSKALNEWEMLALAGTITLLAFAVLVLRYGHINLPYNNNRRKDD